jgi:predicted metalloprotease
VHDSLVTFWGKQLGRPIPDRLVVAPVASDVPASCRSALQLKTAFTCPVDNKIYLTPHYIHELRTRPSRYQGWYRFAATLGHETGHIVQFAVQDPTVEKDHPTLADSREIEQQADCLSGVWAHAVGVNDARFVQAAGQVFAIVDSPHERNTHGTPAERKAAVKRGQVGGTAKSCGLTLG